MEDLIEDLLIEEDLLRQAKKLGKVMAVNNKKHPQKMFLAFVIVLVSSVRQEFEEFIKDLDLSEEDKIEILKGMLFKRIRSDTDSLEGVVDFGNKMVSEFDNLTRKGKKK